MRRGTIFRVTDADADDSAGWRAGQVVPFAYGLRALQDFDFDEVYAEIMTANDLALRLYGGAAGLEATAGTLVRGAIAIMIGRGLVEQIHIPELRLGLRSSTTTWIGARAHCEAEKRTVAPSEQWTRACFVDSDCAENPEIGLMCAASKPPKAWAGVVSEEITARDVKNALAPPGDRKVRADVLHALSGVQSGDPATYGLSV